MRNRLPLAVFAVVACLLVGKSAQGQQFTATLNGAQEVPPVTTNGTGSATGTLTGGPGSWVFTYSGSFSNLTGNSTDAHIHNAAPGVPGPIVHFFDNVTLGGTSGTWSGNWSFNDNPRPLTDALAAALIAGNTYFNIHSTFVGSGEIRGQIVPEPATAGILALAAGAALVRRRR